VECSSSSLLWAKSGHAADSAVIRLCFVDASLAAAFVSEFGTRHTYAGVVILLPSFFCAAGATVQIFSKRFYQNYMRVSLAPR
jgi:hypothetical protein